MMMTMMQILPALLRTNIEEKGGSPIGVLLGFLFCGAMFAFSLYKLIQDYRLCTQPVEALCVNLESRRGRKSTTYAPVWEYTYNGQYIRITSNTFSNVGVPNIGQTYTLYINPDNPEQFRRKISSWLPFVIVTGFFLALILSIIFL